MGFYLFVIFVHFSHIFKVFLVLPHCLGIYFLTQFLMKLIFDLKFVIFFHQWKLFVGVQ